MVCLDARIQSYSISFKELIFKVVICNYYPEYKIALRHKIKAEDEAKTMTKSSRSTARMFLSHVFPDQEFLAKHKAVEIIADDQDKIYACLSTVKFKFRPHIFNSNH